jgi:phage shock protein PspC (stress-responsive transcriptional regulator)
MDSVIFGLIVALRVGVPLAIPRFPLPAIVAALVIDAADQTMLAAFDAEPDNYQGYDKALDIYYLAIAYLSTLRNWPARAAFGTSQFLWYYRLIGVVAFEFSGVRALLIVFPNTFEYFFIAFEAIRLRWDPARLSARNIVFLAAAIWIGIKLPQEYWIHVAQLDFTDALDNPAFATLVVVGLVVLALIAWRLSRRAPAADWSPISFDVDAHRTTVPFRPAEASPDRWWLRLTEYPLVEKTVLTGLTVAVFSQLFEVEASVLQITLACGFIVIVNAWFGGLLRRRGVSWTNSLVQFVALLFVNWGSLFAYEILGGRFGAELQTGPTLVMLGLLTILVILYNRFWAIRQADNAETVTSPWVVRPREGRMIAGVAAGIAQRYGWDPSKVRLALVASMLFPGPQVAFYVAAWLAIPGEPAPELLPNDQSLPVQPSTDALPLDDTPPAAPPSAG